MAEDAIGKAGLYFDELNKIRVLEPEVAVQTNDLKDACKDFIESELNLDFATEICGCCKIPSTNRHHPRPAIRNRSAKSRRITLHYRTASVKGNNRMMDSNYSTYHIELINRSCGRGWLVTLL